MAQEIADSTLLDTWGSGGNIVEPDISKIIEGWQLGEQPPHEYMNWLQNTFGSKLNHILKNGVANWNNETEYLAGSSVQHNGNVWLCKTTNTNSEPTDVNANWKRIITVESLTTVLGGYVATTGNQIITDTKTFSGLSKTSIGDNALEVITSISNAAAGSFMVSQGVKYGLALNGSGTGQETGSFYFQVIDRDLKTVKNTPFRIGVDGVVNFTSSPIVPTPTTGTQAVNKAYVDNVATLNINALNDKATPVDTDNLAIQEVAGVLKKLSWANLKQTLVTYLSTGTGFAVSLTEKGYIKFPSWLGGLIIQWGRTTYIGRTSEILNFPIAFPNNVFAVSTGEQQFAESAVSRTHYSSTKTAITITRDADGKPPGLISVNYIAIGN